MRGKITFIIIIFITTLFINWSCKKEIPCDALVCDECKEKRYDVTEAIYHEMNYKQPCFNPNNSNEFVFIKNKPNFDYLIKYNLVTKKEDTLVIQKSIHSTPKWSKNGTIVFSGWDFQIWIINEDGSNLKRVTTPMNLFGFLYPNWKNDSTIVAEFSINLSVPYYYAEIDLNGKFIDTLINISPSFVTYNDFNEYVYQDVYKKIMLKNSKELNVLVDKNDLKSTVYGLDFHPNGEVVFFTRAIDGIYKINKFSKVETKIRNACTTRVFTDISVSSDGKKILVEREDITNYEDDDWYYNIQSNIYIMDIDGQNERKIEFKDE